jgi:hypothetical protein
MSKEQIQGVALQASAIASSFFFLSMYSSGTLADALLSLSLVISGGALGAMVVSFPGAVKR